MPLDINECTAGNNGGCSQICINTIGSYACSCQAGYVLNADNRTCAGKYAIDTHCKKRSNLYFPDINECANNNGNCTQTCINTIGSYFCSCTAGYALSADGRTCVGMKITCLLIKTCIYIAFKTDINECTTYNGNCSQICTNTIGSYYCLCMNAYVLNVDGRTCNGKGICVDIPSIGTILFVDINECATNNGNCSQYCTNTAGSYLCTCVAGYILNSDNRTCIGWFILFHSTF